MKQTIKQVTDTVKEWCGSHSLIESFTTKSVSELVDVEYPLFIMQPNKIGFNNGSVKQTFAIVIADRLLTDNSNDAVVSSDTAQIMEDFYLNFFDNDDDYDFVITDVTDGTPILDKEPNKILGWIFYVTVEVGSTRNEYAIPKVDPEVIVLTPIMRVYGNTKLIESGSTETSWENGTDFGKIDAEESIGRSFVIKNEGDAKLQLIGTQIIESSSDKFTVTVQPERDINVNGETAFDVLFDPKVAEEGIIESEISIVNNDVLNTPYKFWVSGYYSGYSDVVDPYLQYAIQLLGKTYKSDVDGMYYIEDKTDYGNDALIGDNPVFVGDGSTNYITGSLPARDDYYGVKNIHEFILTSVVDYSYSSTFTDNAGRRYDFYNDGGNKLRIISPKTATSSTVWEFSITLNIGKKYKCEIVHNGLYAVPTLIVNAVEIATAIEEPFDLSTTPNIYGINIIGAAFPKPSSYSGTAKILRYCIDGIIDVKPQSPNGSYEFNLVTKEKLPFLGDLTNIHGTSNLQTPYAHINGCDMWQHPTSLLWKNTPLQDDGTSCQGQFDTDDDGYVWQYKVEGKGLNDKEGLNGTEILYQPEDSTTLPQIENDNFTTRIWYDALGNALPIDVKDITWNHEGANIQFADVSNPPYVDNYMVYDIAPTGQDLEDVKDFVNFKTPSLDFSGEGNSQYITLL